MSPADKLVSDFANLSILSGEPQDFSLIFTILEVSEAVTQFSTSSDFDETGPLDTSGP
jgi:hypothetical protein